MHHATNMYYYIPFPVNRHLFPRLFQAGVSTPKRGYAGITGAVYRPDALHVAQPTNSVRGYTTKLFTV